MHGIDPDHPPEIAGVVDCFPRNGEGEADGLVLKDECSPPFDPAPRCASAVCCRAAVP